jgi:hypothetical protein
MLHVQTEAIEAKATPAPRQRLVVIGNGMSPGRALEKLIEAAPEAYKVTIFNAEPRVNYDRIMLSPVLSGEKTFDQIVIHGDGWYIDHGVTLYKGHRIVAIDREAKTVTSERGVVEPYDKLVVATGSMPILIPVPGSKLAGVLTYRDLDDVNAMLLAAKSRGRAVVIGGGLLGLEAAMGLKEQGMEVSVVHLMPTLMERQLDPPSGFLLKHSIEARGVKVYCKANTKEILGTDPTAGPPRVRGVLLDDGTELPADPRCHGGRHPPERAARPRGGPDGQPRRRRRAGHAHERPGHLRPRRMRRGARPVLRPGRAALRHGEHRRRPARGRRRGRVQPERDRDKTQGHRDQPLLGRRLRRRRGPRGDRAARRRAQRLSAPGHQGRPPDRRRALWRRVARRLGV